MATPYADTLPRSAQQWVEAFTLGAYIALTAKGAPTMRIDGDGERRIAHIRWADADARQWVEAYEEAMINNDPHQRGLWALQSYGLRLAAIHTDAIAALNRNDIDACGRAMGEDLGAQIIALPAGEAIEI